MKINTQTRISTLIKHNPEAIDAIASINPHFNKLRNPVLRAVLAPRVSIADAARIGKCRPEDFFDKLKAIGFEIESESPIKGIEETPATRNTGLLDKIEKKQFTTFDVRPILQSGSDPFTAIMEKVRGLSAGQVLCILNSFEPTPLIRILNKKGCSTHVVQNGEEVFTYIMTSVNISDESEQKPVYFLEKNDFDSRVEKFGDRLRRLDVRMLEMPMPMVTILSNLEELPADHALYVDHKKVPQHLLSEIETRGWQTLICDLAEGDVKLLIFK